VEADTLRKRRARDPSRQRIVVDGNRWHWQRLRGAEFGKIPWIPPVLVPKMVGGELERTENPFDSESLAT
jgi:hypothetical protein